MTAIQWTDKTWNPIVGCSRVSEGCRHCYAEQAALGVWRRLNAMKEAGKLSHHGQQTLDAYRSVLKERDGFIHPRWSNEVAFLEHKLDEPLGWRKPQRVFVNSMSDLFHEKVSDDQIAAIFGVMAACPQHVFQVLTKRPERALKWFREVEAHAKYCGIPHSEWPFSEACILTNNDDRLFHGFSPGVWPLPNVWLGVSVEDQATASERIPLLLQCPAAVRWISAEPLLGPVDLCAIGDDDCFPGIRYNALSGVLSSAPMDTGGRSLDWVVVGGESGEGARDCDPRWIRAIVDQCQNLRVPVFVKQLGGEHDKRGDIERFPTDLRVREWPRQVQP